jgi:carbamoylphosphate synthase small subunit
LQVDFSNVRINSTFQALSEPLHYTRKKESRPMQHKWIAILDFGSQYTQLIARRVREQQVYSEILRFDTSAAALRERAPAGIILSGGPNSVFEEAPRSATRDFELGLPVLGICYGNAAHRQDARRNRPSRHPSRIRTHAHRGRRGQPPVRRLPPNSTSG